MVPRLTKDEYDARIENIKRSILAHDGKPTIAIVRNGREWTSVIGTLVCANNRAYVRHAVYNDDGTVRGRQNLYLNPVLIHTGDTKVVWFDEGL